MARRSSISADVDEALKQALERLLVPVAQLCLARGMTFGTAAEVLKHAYVDAARSAQGASAGQRDISRVSTATGLTRREVTRITNDVTTPAMQRSSPATQVFTAWLSKRRLRDKDGRPLALKRQGRAPSFEALAQSVTRDVHPRSLLEDLCRLGLARHDEASDTVELLEGSFVPKQDKVRMFEFLGNNVGDHLCAAVANVLADQPPHVEQAVFADELSDESLAEVRKLVSQQWTDLLAAMVPQLEALIDADKAAGRPAGKRVRVGLYSFHDDMPKPTDY